MVNRDMCVSLRRQAQAWLTQIEGLQNSEHYPYLETLETIVAKARPIPVYFDVLSGVSIFTWRNEAEKKWWK